MARTERVVNASAEQIFAVLSDGWTYSDWVVGTAHIRDVDPDWPAPGTAVHHKAGPWPFSLRDSTIALDCERPWTLVLAPRLWPLGEGRVRIELREIAPGTTRVTLTEDFAEGPLRWVRTKINDLALHWRNRESLRRLADLAVSRARRSAPRGAA